MPDLLMVVDTALAEVPVNVLPLLDDTDFKTIETAVAYNAAGMALKWNFVTTAGAYTQTAVTPTTGGVHDWTHQGGGMYTIEIPTSSGDINNDAEGFGWFSGVATGVLPWRGPTIAFVKDHVAKGLIDGTEWLQVDAHAPNFSVASGTLAVKKPDGTTTAYTKTVTSDAAAEPITGAS